MVRIISALCVSLTIAASARSQTVLNLVPADCGGALVIKGIDDLKKKGDAFFAETKTEEFGRPSQLFNLIFVNLGIQGGVHGKLPTGILVASPKKAGVAGLDFSTLDKLLVLAIPYNDLDQLSKSFGFAPGQLKKNVMSTGKGQNFGTHFYVDGDYLYFGNNPRAVEAVVKQPSLAKSLDAEQVRVLGDPDIMLMLEKQILTDTWRFFGNTEELVNAAADDEKEIVRELVAGLNNVRYLMVNIRIDGGLGGSLLTVFEKNKNASVEKLLSRLRGRGEPAALRGLPEGRLVAAQALQGDGSQNTAVVKALLNMLFRQQQVQTLLSYAHRPNMIAAFTELMHHLQGVRFAIYQNSLADDVGHLSAVSILETEDSSKFLADIKDLAKFANSDNLDLTAKTGGDNVVAIRKLVEELGSNSYRLRESAMVRLALAGERVLPYLEEALKATDLEASQRARKLQERILATAAERRKELLSDDIFRRIKPSLVFSTKTENWQGDNIYSAYVKLDDAAAIEPKLRDLLGPEWNRVRFAVHGKEVAVLFGSNRDLLKETLTNLKENKPGLASSKTFAGFTGHSNAKRNFEIHVAGRTMMSLINPTPLNEREQIAASPGPTSLSMTVGGDSIQIDLWVPPPEFALFWKAFQ